MDRHPFRRLDDILRELVVVSVHEVLLVEQDFIRKDATVHDARHFDVPTALIVKALFRFHMDVWIGCTEADELLRLREPEVCFLRQVRRLLNLVQVELRQGEHRLERVRHLGRVRAPRDDGDAVVGDVLLRLVIRERDAAEAVVPNARLHFLRAAVTIDKVGRHTVGKSCHAEAVRPPADVVMGNLGEL